MSSRGTAATPRIASERGAAPLGGLARGISLNLAGSMTSKVVTFVIALLLSNLLGKVAVGRYAQAFAVLTVLEQLAMMPFGSGLMRVVAVHRGDAQSVRGTIRAAVGLTGVTAALLGGAVFVAAPWLADEGLHDPGLLVPLRLVAVATVPMALADSMLNSTMGFQRMRAYAVVKLVSEPVLRLGLLVVLVAIGLGATGAVAALVASCSVEAVLAWLALRRLAGRWYAGAARYRIGELSAFSVPTGLAAFAGLGLVWADSLILGAYRSSGDVGVYQVATRIMLLATFVIPAVNVAFAPRIAALTHRGDFASLHDAYALVTTWTLRLSVPSFVILVVFTRDILRLFGPAFPSAFAVTLVLLLGALCNAVTGPGVHMLTMSGHPRWGATNNAFGLVLNLALNFVLIPRFGIMGAACAWAAAMIALNLSRLVEVHHLLGMWPFNRRQVLVLVSGVAAAVAGALATYWLGWPLRLLAGSVIVAAVYLALTAWELDDDDRAFLRAVTRFRRSGVTSVGPG